MDLLSLIYKQKHKKFVVMAQSDHELVRDFIENFTTLKAVICDSNTVIDDTIDVAITDSYQTQAKHIEGYIDLTAGVMLNEELLEEYGYIKHYYPQNNWEFSNKGDVFFINTRSNLFKVVTKFDIIESIYIEEKDETFKKIIHINCPLKIQNAELSYLYDMFDTWLVPDIISSEVLQNTHKYARVCNFVVHKNITKLSDIISIKNKTMAKKIIFASSLGMPPSFARQYKAVRSSFLLSCIVDDILILSNNEYNSYDFNHICETDMVIHQEYGIGIFRGTQIITLGKKDYEVATIEYKNKDKILVPLEDLNTIYRYSAYNENIQLDSLKTQVWQKKREKIQKHVLEIANELIAHAALRKKIPIIPMAMPESEIIDYIGSLPYVLTKDQVRCVDDVKTDMSSSYLMDRMICGDVGFGKTEIALIACLISILNNKQVAVIAPTTLLCRQLYELFSSKFTKYVCKEMSRMSSNDPITRADIVIGTCGITKHKFDNLGLIIIDEEQSFGVKQKEAFKKLGTSAHILTLTATPIPRTLHMALSGLQDLSLLSTPPKERLPVKIFVKHLIIELMCDLIAREIARNGQVFVVVPKISMIEECYEVIHQAIPSLRICIAHGQKNDLMQTIQDFRDHKFDLLVSTNIVEAGLDIQNANTMLVYKADFFGLAQLYQLKGRVGRSTKKAYVYFITKEKNCERLAVLNSMQDLGSNFNLATHDMDQRGSGNVLGQDQSGHVKEIGIEMYQQMLSLALCKERLT